MSKLPVDVLLSIFPLLVTRDQLECMTVCRQWHDIILHYSLFRVIYIDNKQQLNSLIQRVMREPVLGQKVKQLTLTSLCDQNCDVPIIDTLFPNVRHFTIMNDKDYYKGIHTIIPFQIHPWRNDIERVAECYTDVYTLALLSSGLCKNLTFIAVRRQDERSPRSLINALTNAPGLKTLHLYRYIILFQDLELLHETVPLFNSFLLKRIAFANAWIPPNITPAPLLKSFHCISCDTSSNYFAEHFPYISQKYRCLEDLALGVRPGRPWETISVNSIEEQKTMISAYVGTLGPQLKTLALSLNDSGFWDRDELFYFNILDQSGYEIENITLYCRMDITIPNCLAHSTQTQHIRSLTINLALIGTQKSISFKWLASFTMLKELSLYFLEYPASISILKSILVGLGENSLEILRLNDMILVPDDLHMDFVYPLLQKLELFNIHFSTGSDIEMSRVLPNLKFLKMENCSKETGTITLPNTNLCHLEIINSIVDKDYSISIITLSNKRQVSYHKNTKFYFVQSDTEDIEKNTLSFPLTFTQSDHMSIYIPIRNAV